MMRTFRFALLEEHTQICPTDPFGCIERAIEIKPVAFTRIVRGIWHCGSKAPERKPVLMKVQHKCELYANKNGRKKSQ